VSTHAAAVFEIKTWDEKPYEEIEGGSKLTRVSVTKTYGGRAGSFVLQVNGTYRDQKATCDCTVVPDSGSGELNGLA
jgi:hypothetical protein